MTPILCNKLAMMRPNDVFPVPGLPWKIMCGAFAMPWTAWPRFRRVLSSMTDR